MIQGECELCQHEATEPCLMCTVINDKWELKYVYKAAPALLEACEAAYNFITNAETTQERRQRVAGQLYNALAKAEGKEGF